MLGSAVGDQVPVPVPASNGTLQNLKQTVRVRHSYHSLCLQYVVTEPTHAHVHDQRGGGAGVHACRADSETWKRSPVSR